MTETGGTIIVTRSFSLAPAAISWTEVIGTRRGATIYTYGDLLPDEVIANVQTALQDTGYYYGEITGSLGVDTRTALANFQRDYGLQITGAIDEGTVEALGLY